jgi:hypothetical protein
VLDCSFQLLPRKAMPLARVNAEFPIDAFLICFVNAENWMKNPLSTVSLGQ